MDQALERRQLRIQLRRFREHAGLTQRQVSLGLGWSASKVQRIEAGTSSISEADLRSLLARYSTAAENEVAQLMSVARSTRRAGLIPITPSITAPTPPSVRGYPDYEATAAQIWNFEPLFVPGLLQTQDYTRALISQVGLHGPAPETIGRTLVTRLCRQEILHRTPGVQLHALIDESALERQIGGHRVMAEQMEHLWAMSERANIAVGIVPLAGGAYPAMRSPFVVMRFADPTHPELLFLESPGAGQITVGEDPGADGPNAYREVFTQIWALADTGRAATERLRAAWWNASELAATH